MRKYRQRAKENCNPEKRRTRAEQIVFEKQKQQREYWRIKKQEYRNRKHPQEKRRCNEKRRQEYQLRVSLGNMRNIKKNNMTKMNMTMKKMTIKKKAMKKKTIIAKQKIKKKNILLSEMFCKRLID
ncbi:hypothetical protein SNE40_017553 [Patella caerulea]|uniref:Uncharacterized protein n=1 Tax=Patella caerulea TaxID=87958 RepID=A0AAN8P9X0_PATCE